MIASVRCIDIYSYFTSFDNTQRTAFGKKAKIRNRDIFFDIFDSADAAKQDRRTGYGRVCKYFFNVQ